MSLASTVLRQLEKDTMESPNTPNPARIDVWGENRVLGIIIPNVEKVTSGGWAVTPDSQNIPTSMQIIKISEKVTDEYPKLKAIQEKYDPEKTGKIMEDGPYVTFAFNGNPDSWPYMSSDGTFEFSLLHARSIRGSYEPMLGKEVFDFEEKGDDANVEQKEV